MRDTSTARVGIPLRTTISRGTRGRAVGASRTPAKNIGVLAKYFNGKYITGHGDAEKIFGRVEFFF